MDELCKSVFMSQAWGFSASEFLSFPETTSHRQSNSFDFDSIMIYGFTAGAKTVDGKKQPTLTKWDGTLIASMKEPSGRDAEAIRILYPSVIDERLGGSSRLTAVWNFGGGNLVDSTRELEEVTRKNINHDYIPNAKNRESIILTANYSRTPTRVMKSKLGVNWVRISTLGGTGVIWR